MPSAETISGFESPWARASRISSWRGVSSFARYTFRPTSYFDSASVTQESIRWQILEAGKSGRAPCFISHMQPSPKMKGGWSEWMNETRALLKWLRENGIPVRTMSGMVECLYGSQKE